MLQSVKQTQALELTIAFSPQNCIDTYFCRTHCHHRWCCPPSFCCARQWPCLHLLNPAEASVLAVSTQTPLSLRWELRVDCQAVWLDKRQKFGTELNEPLEFICKWLVIQEHIGIPITPIEPILNRSHCPNCTFQVRVPGQDNKGGVCSGFIRGIHTCWREGWEFFRRTVVVVVVWGWSR